MGMYVFANDLLEQEFVGDGSAIKCMRRRGMEDDRECVNVRNFFQRYTGHGCWLIEMEVSALGGKEKGKG